MSKENALRAYKHFRDLEKNYEPREGLNSGPTSKTRVRARAKASAEDILIRNPEFPEVAKFGSYEAYEKHLKDEAEKKAKAEAEAKAKKEAEAKAAKAVKDAKR